MTNAERMAAARSTPEYKARQSIAKVWQEIQRRRAYHRWSIADALYYFNRPRPELLTAIYPNGKIPANLLPKSKSITALTTPIVLTDEDIAVWTAEQVRLGQDTTIPEDETGKDDAYWDALVRDPKNPESPLYG